MKLSGYSNSFIFYITENQTPFIFVTSILLYSSYLLITHTQPSLHTLNPHYTQLFSTIWQFTIKNYFFTNPLKVFQINLLTVYKTRIGWYSLKRSNFPHPQRFLEHFESQKRYHLLLLLKYIIMIDKMVCYLKIIILVSINKINLERLW